MLVVVVSVPVPEVPYSVNDVLVALVFIAVMLLLMYAVLVPVVL